MLNWLQLLVDSEPPQQPRFRIVRDTERRSAEASQKFVRYTAYGVIGCYAVTILYKSGAFSAVLPNNWREAIDRKVAAVAQKTEPRASSATIRLAKKHLVQVYSAVAGSFLASVAGSWAFFRYPFVPIGLSIAVTAVPTSVIFLTKPEDVAEFGRAALFYVAAFSCGYSFGPLEWIAYDSLIPFLCVLGSTVAGFCVPLYITRGKMSYLLSSQLLSCSLAIVSSQEFAEKNKSDVNVMLTLQLISNALLGALHTIPTIQRLVSCTEPNCAEDPYKEATLIFGAAAYSIWWIFRQLVLSIMIKFAPRGEERVNVVTTKEDRRRSGAAAIRIVEQSSDVAASLLFLLLYVKFVSYAQERRARSQFNVARHAFAQASPLRWLFE